MAVKPEATPQDLDKPVAGDQTTAKLPAITDAADNEVFKQVKDGTKLAAAGSLTDFALTDTPERGKTTAPETQATPGKQGDAAAKPGDKPKDADAEAAAQQGKKNYQKLENSDGSKIEMWDNADGSMSVKVNQPDGDGMEFKGKKEFHQNGKPKAFVIDEVRNFDEKGETTTTARRNGNSWQGYSKENMPIGQPFRGKVELEPGYVMKFTPAENPNIARRVEPNGRDTWTANDKASGQKFILSESDADGKRVKMEDLPGVKDAIAKDGKHGRLEKNDDGSEVSYDKIGGKDQPTKVVQPDGTSRTYGYGEDGKPNMVIDRDKDGKITAVSQLGERDKWTHQAGDTKT
ncbi:MAG: hypothetical protein K8F91_04025, partial [Candidatus Obscuribacterales bacterium]|nr:hypothetical protein [Candidatus Obscuribacterales bacterium]